MRSCLTDLHSSLSFPLTLNYCPSLYAYIGLGLSLSAFAARANFHCRISLPSIQKVQISFLLPACLARAKYYTMEAKATRRTCGRDHLLLTTSNVHHCYNCKSSNSSSQIAREQKVDCSGCGRQFVVPASTTMYRCLSCETKSRIHRKSSDNIGMSSSLEVYSLSLTRRCNKRAVLCGITYRKKKYSLKGPINDVHNMRELLINKFGFVSDSIRVLTEEKDPSSTPIKKNILESLRWLVKDTEGGDSLVFYFSGHGSQQIDSKEDEIDRLDETLCPSDFMQQGMIIDNYINSSIVQPLKVGVTLHAIIDACHSGTMLDLMYVYNQENGTWESNKPPSKEPIRKHTNGGQAICISACRDSQLAADTTAFGGKGMNGLMTYIFTKLIKENPEITYGGLLEEMDKEIEKTIQSRCHVGFLKHLFHPRIAQDVVLSSSKKFDVSQKFSL